MKSFAREKGEIHCRYQKEPELKFICRIRPKAAYRRLQKAFEQEFLQTFGGCTVIKNIKGLYLSDDEKTDSDKINLFTPTRRLISRKISKALSKYTDELTRSGARSFSEEESILIVVHQIYHSVYKYKIMCGIVGYVGNKQVVPLIIDGLRKLEYRGYDSAGIAVVDENNDLEIRRAEGKLAQSRRMHSSQSAGRKLRHRAYALGDARATDRRKRASAPRLHRAESSSCITALSKIICP